MLYVYLVMNYIRRVFISIIQNMYTSSFFRIREYVTSIYHHMPCAGSNILHHTTEEPIYSSKFINFVVSCVIFRSFFSDNKLGDLDLSLNMLTEDK